MAIPGHCSGLSLEERRGQKLNRAKKALDDKRVALGKLEEKCKLQVAEANADRERAENALSALHAEFRRVRDRLKRAEAQLRSLGVTIEP